MDRIGELIDDRASVVVADGPDLRFYVVRRRVHPTADELKRGSESICESPRRSTLKFPIVPDIDEPNPRSSRSLRLKWVDRGGIHVQG